MHKALITTVPFGAIDPKPLKLLQAHEGMEVLVNPIGRRLTSPELTELIGDVTVLIAGTEPITKDSLERAEKLQIICRVGIGLDNVDLITARQRDIKVAYTPDAPAPAVAELTMAHILNLLRFLGRAEREMRKKVWFRRMGRRIATSTVGIIGAGRIGGRVIRHLSGFRPQRLLVNDLVDISQLCANFDCIKASKEQIYSEADVISLHLPLTPLTHNLIGIEQLRTMKRSAVLINTSRGGMVNEQDLYDALQAEEISGAAVDVFEDEPYAGPLLELENCVLSCHMGSCTEDCRFTMELEAVEEALRFLRGNPLVNEVPAQEYENQQQS